jgi:hypothetical protein
MGLNRVADWVAISFPQFDKINPILPQRGVVEIKEQFKQDEELIVKIFKLERFFRKHKWKLIILSVLVVGGGIGYWIYSLWEAHRIEVANQLLYRLTHGEKNPQLMQELKKEDKSLYDLYLLSSTDPKGWKKVTTSPLDQIAQYKLAVEKGTIQSLEHYLYNPQTHFLKDNVRFLLIYLYLKKGERKRALTLYKEITNPDIKGSAKLLLHYGIVSNSN